MDIPEYARNLGPKAALGLLVCAWRQCRSELCYFVLRGQSPALWRHIHQSSVPFCLITHCILHVCNLYWASTTIGGSIVMPILQMRKQEFRKGKWFVGGLTVRKTATPRQESQAQPLLQCSFSPTVLLYGVSCPRETWIQYSTAKACHKTQSPIHPGEDSGQSQRHICFLSDLRRSPVSCETLGSWVWSGEA